MKKIIWLIMCILCVSFTANSVSASCAFSIDKKTGYSPGESIFYTVKCTLLAESNKAYSLTIYNSTGAAMSTVGGITAAQDVYFYDEDLIPVEWTNQTNAYVNLTVDGTFRQKISFNVSGLNARNLFLTSPVVAYGGDWYWNEIDAIGIVVTNYENHPVANAICKIDISDSVSGEPFFTQNDIWTGSTGVVMFAIPVSFDVFDIGTYAFKISCITTSESIDTYTGEIAHIASGHVSGVFYVNDLVTNISVYLYSSLNSTQTQVNDHICVNFTNSYRNYSDAYVIRYQLLCDVPSQDVEVFQHTGQETVEANSIGMFCPPIKIPEMAASGTGYCYAKADVVPASLAAEGFTGDYLEISNLFYVIPSFAIGGLAYKSSQTSFYAEFYMGKNMPSGSLIRMLIPKEIENAWNFDKVKDVYMIYNGSRYDGIFTTGERTMVDNYGISAEGIETTFEIWVNISNKSVVANQIMYIYATGYSEANFWEQMIAALNGIWAALLNLAGLGTTDATPIGNYTAIASALISSVVNDSVPLQINYSVIVSNTTRRKDLHFVYEFAPLISGTEGAFRDQNPSIEGYQSLGVYQAIILNQTKEFKIILYPNLLANTNYTIYETIYEVNGPSDERIVAQHSYNIYTTQDMVPEFDGSVIRVEGEVMQVIS